jgi:pyrimidine oxygenase
MPTGNLQIQTWRRVVVELGIFLPIGNNGWIMSDTAPVAMPTWELNRDGALLAEEVGFDYVFSMAKWRGVGGKTRFWDYTIESLTLMSALASITNRVRLIGSVSPTLMHPAVFAKMAVTLDHISHGRYTLNIVSAANESEYAQMGLLPDGFQSYRYAYTEEWLRIAKALWTEPSVTFKGRFFNLEDCRSDPKPVQQPHPPIVCATGSDEGIEFVAEHCDAMFVGGDEAHLRAATPRLHAAAAARGRSVKTHALILLVIADTDDEAQAQVDGYRRGADWDAMARVYAWRMRKDDGAAAVSVQERLAEPQYMYYWTPDYVGGPQTIADAITKLAAAGADGLVITFPDYIDGLRRMQRDVMPILKRRGLLSESAAGAVV